MQVLQNLVDLGTAIALRHDEAAARNLLINYPPPPDLSEMDPGALRAWADIAFTADDAELAAGFYRRLAATASDSYWPPFQIGRLRLRAKDFAGAVEHLALAAAREPRFGWAWYELCRCHSHLKNTKQLAAAALGFSAADRVELLAPHFRILAEAANHLFEEKLFEESFGIYSIVLDQGCTDDLVRARHAEYFIRKRDFETAIRLLKPCWDAQKLGDWGVRTLARAYSESGDTNSAQEILREIIRKHPRNIAFTRDYICLLCEQGLAAEAAEFFSNARAQLSDRARLELQIVYLSEICEYDKLLKVLAENPRSGGNVILRSLDRAIASCAYKAKDYPTALALIEKRIARFGPSEHITLCRLNTAFATRNWSLLGQFLAEIPPETFARRIEFRVKLFEYYCNSGLMAKAKAALESLGPVSELPRRFLLPVLRYHGERGDWSSVVQIGLDALDHAFNFEDTGHLLVRAIRKTGSSVLATQRIERLLAFSRTASLVKLQIAVRQDEAALESTDQLTAEENSQEFSPFYQREIFTRLVQRLGNPRPVTAKKFAIYYCTDVGYLGPSFVSLASLIQTNRDLLEAADVYLLIDDPEATELATRLATKLSERLGLDPIRVLPREEVVGDGISLKTAYGMFTGGQSLSEACYYRIFFAKYLRERGQHDLALYIDSDTVIHGDLNPLFYLRADAPLVARLEVSRPEVVATIAKHRLEAGQYFNSGVLTFHLKHPDFDAALDKTLFAVQHSRDHLVFQDQCALNIGFQGAFQKLDPKFNFFISPFDPSPSTDAAILHFLDRPKPWDPSYGGKLCRMWFLQWNNLAVHIGPEDAMALYRMMNRT